MATQTQVKTGTNEAVTISISVARRWREVYEQLWHPEQFPKWASGLSKSDLKRESEWWSGEGPEGPIRIRFTDHNDFGILDHWVDLGGGTTLYIPFRVVENGDDAEMLLTLFRVPGMSDTKFSEDQDWVRRDLAALKRWAEG